MRSNHWPNAINWVNGSYSQPASDSWVNKYDPHTGSLLVRVANSSDVDVDYAVRSAYEAFSSWSVLSPVKRGKLLLDAARFMKAEASTLAECIAVETGKSPADAIAEVDASVLQAEFFAGEGMRLYGRSLTSSIQGRSCHTVRQPHGVAGLIVPANTPLANIAWKVFPALVCGNSAVLKASEDSPSIANLLAELLQKCGLPDGVFNVVQGGPAAGEALVEHQSVPVISFTGSTRVGRAIARSASSRLARVSLELGGKNAVVVCDDANLEQAVHWASLSAFSNAGQRCAAASRMYIFDRVYDQFVSKLVSKANSLVLGVSEGCDLGPVISKRQHQNILAAITNAKEAGGQVLCGGGAPTDSHVRNGYYVLPTVIAGLDENADINKNEIFGPVVTVQKVTDLTQALFLVNSSEFGLTSSIHTTNVDRAMWFAQRVRSGLVNVNFGTFGSEPHMPFGGFGSSGNGTREPGVEALDVYSELKNISFLTRESLI
jgi:acyl-CoA reductase-like NAD-dependent aldehyde dehydrogenase